MQKITAIVCTFVCKFGEPKDIGNYTSFDLAEEPLTIRSVLRTNFSGFTVTLSPASISLISNRAAS